MQFGKSNKSPLEAFAYQEQRQHTPLLYHYVYSTHTLVTADIKTTATQLNLVIINNAMRCIGHIQRSDLKQGTHIPLFLPRKSHLVNLLILHLHEKHQHCSVTQTMPYFRQYFWTPQLRPVIASILHACVTCRCVYPRTIPPALRHLLYQMFESNTISHSNVWEWTTLDHSTYVDASRARDTSPSSCALQHATFTLKFHLQNPP